MSFASRLQDIVFQDNTWLCSFMECGDIYKEDLTTVSGMFYEPLEAKQISFQWEAGLISCRLRLFIDS